MGFSLSPAVTVRERDATNIVPVVSSSTGATAGQFLWGAADQVTIVDNEERLAALFGSTSLTVFADFLVAAQFLAYASNLHVVRVVAEDAKNATATELVGSGGLLIKNQDHYESLDLTSSTNLWIAKYAGILGNSVGVAWVDSEGFDEIGSDGEYLWPWRNLFDTAPDDNEFHIVVYDVDGRITGLAGSAVERFPYVSTVRTAKNYDGTSAYFANVVNGQSQWVWVGNETLFTGTNDGVALAGGADGSDITEAERQAGFALFRNVEELDISLVFAASGGATTSRYIIDQVAEYRKDAVAFVSPMSSDVLGVSDEQVILNNIIQTRNGYGSSSYAFMDSAYKYVYDRYQDLYRWIPLNGDMAGLCARADAEFDPWMSPAGNTRGRIKNVVKFSHKQPKAIRDELYKRGINPVLVQPTDGAVLWGDKTLQSKPSAFDRINVRRLFIVLEKSIATASQYFLFENNTDVTRSRFTNMVEPYLRDVQGRGGVTDFRVVCNDSNNTPEVIDRNEMVGQIYIKPVRSINEIVLDFVATRTGVNFDEIVLSTTN